MTHPNAGATRLQDRRYATGGTHAIPGAPSLAYAAAYAVWCGANTPRRLAREWTTNGIDTVTAAGSCLAMAWAAGWITPGPDGFAITALFMEIAA